ncbi:MAG TPA: DUF559 domain-containing protein [Rhizomicrobium sp.]|jgi:very-short-patch-repair endonuclease
MLLSMVTETTKEKRIAGGTLETRDKEMRHAPVAMEKLLWAHVRNRKLSGFKFRRQVPIGPYIADFACLERHLIVELDGPLHAGREGSHAARDRYLEREGFRVMRFANEDFAGDFHNVLRARMRVAARGLSHLVCV